MSEKTWAEEIAEAEEALGNARREVMQFWMAYQQALKEVDAAVLQLMKLRVDGPANAEAKSEEGK